MTTRELFVVITVSIIMSNVFGMVVYATMRWLRAPAPSAPLPTELEREYMNAVGDPLLDAYRDGWRASEECWGIPVGKVPSSDEHIDHHFTWDGSRRAKEKCPPRVA